VAYDSFTKDGKPYSLKIKFDGAHSGKSAYYSHMASSDGKTSYITVPNGSYVSAGQQIGYQGAYGVKSMHLHISYLSNSNGYEVPFANTLDPTTFLKANNLVYTSGWKSQGSMTCQNTATPTQLNLKVTIPGRTSSQVSIRIRNSNGSGIRWQNNIGGVTSDSWYNGISLGDLPTGSYDIYVRTSHSLWQVKTATLTRNTANSIEFTGNFALQGGDFDQDDGITILDFQAFANAYYPRPPDPAFNLAGDHLINIADFAYFAERYQDLGAEANRGLTPKPGPQVASTQVEPMAASATGSLSLSPGNGTYTVGNEFDVNILIDSSGQPTKGANVVLRYDSCALQYVSFTRGPIFDSSFESINLPSEGTLRVGANASVAGSGSSVNGNLGTVRFRVIRGNVQSPVRIDYEPLDTLDSNISLNSSPVDILGSISNAQYTLQGTPSRIIGSGTLLPESNSALTGYQIPIKLNPADGCGQPIAQSVRFESFYDGGWHVLYEDTEEKDGWGIDWIPEDIEDQTISLKAVVTGFDLRTYEVIASNILLDRTPPSFEVFDAPVEMSSTGSSILTWVASDTVSSVSSFDLQHRIYPNGEWANLVTDLTDSGFVVNGLDLGEVYEFRVQAWDGAENGSGFIDPIRISAGYEPDDSSTEAKDINNGDIQHRSLYTAGDVDWAKFTLTEESAISISTSGSSGDTRMWLFDQNLTEIDFNDDEWEGSYFSVINRSCNSNPLPPGTYYVKVDEYNNSEIFNYELQFNINEDCTDNTLPEVTWIAPAVAHNSYDAYGELVTLKANATDNRGVTKVRFDWWDNTAQQRVLIGEDTTAPYEVNLDTNTLTGCHIVNAGAFDAAGNFKEDYIWVCLYPPMAPALNTISNPEQDGIYTVSWSTVNGATGYSLEEQFNSGSWQAVSGVSGTSRVFTGKPEGTWCYRVAANNNAGAGDWSTNQCTTVAGAPSFPNTFYISPSNNKKIGNIAAASADILRYEKSTNTWTMIYDGSVRGTTKNITAFDIMDDGSLLLVFGANQKMTIGGSTQTATPYDIVKFTPYNPNVFPLGGGTYEWFFQGKPNGLSVGAEKIDSLDYAGNRLLLSTTGTANVTLPNGTAFKPTKEDVFVFNRTTNQWESTPVIDGSMIPELKGKNISSVWDDPNSNDYYVTITGAFKIGGVKGNAQSIVKLTPNGAGFTPSFVDWLAPSVKFPSNLDGLDIAP